MSGGYNSTNESKELPGIDQSQALKLVSDSSLAMICSVGDASCHNPFNTIVYYDF